MKKALFWKEEKPEMARQIGHVEMVDEAAKIDSWTNCFRCMMDTIEIPAELESKEFWQLEVVDVDGNWVIQEKTVFYSEPNPDDV